MAKTKISEFDTNPDLNTDINSINIAEGCAPSGINNAIRTLMSDLKEWQSGAQDIYIAPAGTAAAPSWTFNGDTDTGLYRVTANELGVAAGGSAVGRFTSAGFVGNVTGNLTGNVTGNVDGNLTAASPTAATQVAGTNNTTVATTAFVTAAISAALLANIYPVGSIYINATNSTNPASLLGFGTWSAFGAGRVPVGFDSGNALFDSAEETGGSADAIVVSHTHSFSATSSGQSATHTHSGTTDSAGTHTHSATFATSTGGNQYFFEGRIPGSTGTITDGINSAGAHTHTFATGNASGDHTHSVSGTTGSTGSSGTNANYQPYITVYMWKRTA